MALGTSAEHEGAEAHLAEDLARHDAKDRIAVRVASRRTCAAGIVLFDLVAADGAALPRFTAGAHIDVDTPSGATRQYSLCNDPSEARTYQIAVLDDPRGRGGSRSMHEDVRRGDTLRIGAPRNRFELVEGAHHSVLFAGGIGITPLIAMAERLHALGRAFELHYCTRDMARTAFVERILRSAWSRSVHFHFDDGAGPKLDLPAVLARQPRGSHLYTCGPAGFMDVVLSSASVSGWAPEQLHSEFFARAPQAPTSTATEGAFDVEIASTGRVIRVQPHQTVVAALAAAGVHIPVSCEQGICGTCMTGVLEGQIDHRDMYLQDSERTTQRVFLPCCSRARSARLVLDL